MEHTADGPPDVIDLGAFVGRLAARPRLRYDGAGDRPPAKIPWDDPGFSERMLREHLDEAHDHASRRGSTVDAHVDWIYEELLAGQPGSVLDLGCGPGLYTERLAARGCRCRGVDISPASIEHARRVARDGELDCTYDLDDIRRADLGTGHDMAMMLFGELNTFSRSDVTTILRRIAASLRPGGTVLLEVHTFESVAAEGRQPAGWYTSTGGLFSDRPHLVLVEHAWSEPDAVARTHLHVVDDTGFVVEYDESLHAWGDEEYRAALLDAGFEQPTVTASMGAVEDPTMIAVTARRP